MVAETKAFNKKSIDNIDKTADKTPKDNIGVSPKAISGGISQVWQGLDTARLEAIFSARHLGKVRKIVSGMIGKTGEFEEKTGQKRGVFERWYEHPTGARIGVGKRISEGEVDNNAACLEIPHRILFKLGQSRIRRLTRTLEKKSDLRFSRNYVAIEENTQKVTKGARKGKEKLRKERKSKSQREINAGGLKIILPRVEGEKKTKYKEDPLRMRELIARAVKQMGSKAVRLIVQLVGKQEQDTEEEEKEPKYGFEVEKKEEKKGKDQKPRLEFRADWVQGTFHVEKLEEAKRIVVKILGEREEFGEEKGKEIEKKLKEENPKETVEFEERPYGIRYFEKSYRHPSGVIAGVGHRKPGKMLLDNNVAYLEIPGSVLSTMTQSRVRKLMRALQEECKFKCTRVDVAIDDYAKTFDVRTVALAKDKHHYTGFGNTGQHIKNGRNGSLGEMVTFGNRGSRGGGKRICQYDKSIESKGKIDAMRIELSCYKHYAVQLFEHLCAVEVIAWGELIGAWISGAIDFRRRQGEKDKNPGKRRRLGWWAKIVKGFAQIKPGRTYTPDSIEKVKAWLVKQVAPSLAVMAHRMWGEAKEGEDQLREFMYGEFVEFMMELLVNGESRFKDKHHYLINSC